MVVRCVENRENDRGRRGVDGKGKGGVAVSREGSLLNCLEGCPCGRSQQRTSFREKKTGQCDHVGRQQPGISIPSINLSGISGIGF